jgi:excinuclease UvrABC ATPase subunit
MATDTNNEVVETETRAIDTNAETVGSETRATDTIAEAVETETRATDVNATDTIAEAVGTETRATDTNAETVETETRATNRNTEPAESEIRPDLVWDNEAPGLCVRCYGDGAKKFIFVYRIGDRQRFIRIGQTPVWSLEAARIRAKELRSIVEQGRDPARGNRGREIPPVENIIQYIAEHLRTNP